MNALPLLHAGIKAAKFQVGKDELNDKIFYLTEDNLWFCWKNYEKHDILGNSKQMDAGSMYMFLKLYVSFAHGVDTIL